jgi:tetratricopeptide (TPR) repeat protein
MSDGSKSRKALPRAVPLPPQTPPSTAQPAVPVAKAVPAPSVPAAPRETPQLARPSSRYQAKRRKSSLQSAVIIVSLLVVLAGACGAAYFVLLAPRPQPRIVLKTIPAQNVDELTELVVDVPAEPRDLPASELHYRLASAPKGAAIDEKNGRITWTPAEDQGPGTHTITVVVSSAGPPEVSATGTFSVAVQEVNQPPVITAIAPQTAKPGDEITFKIEATDPDIPARPLLFGLEAGAPQGAKVHPKTGVFTWTPPAESTKRTVQFTARVIETGAKGLSATQSFSIEVVPAEPGPLDKLLAALRQGGVTVEDAGDDPFPPFTGKCHVVRVQDQLVRVVEYASGEAAASDAAQVSPDAAKLFGKPMNWDAPPHVYRKDALLALYTGKDAKVLAVLEGHFGRPFAIGKVMEEKPKIVSRPPVEPGSEELKQLVALYTTNKKLFVVKEYPTLRKLFSDRFAREHEAEIKAGFGPDYDAMQSFFQDRAAIKEDLYLALDPRHDKVPAALGLFRDLYKQFPKKIEQYANLAIAVAVTWDKPEGLYDYEQHQQRTRSKMPDGRVGAMENFKFFIEREQMMQGRARFLPWEFLVHMVDHKTPLVERDWALREYLPRRVMFGRSYQDVPYDIGMLNSEGRECKLQGQMYTLPNIRSFGGVCAMQADFAGRVGKSLGVPASYVWGASRFGELHAWVMWVELKQVTENNIVFSLESHGRYRGDKYYVGKMEDPHTGTETTDRVTELRLHTVGLSPHAKRQADLIMSAYRMLRDELKMEVEEQLAFLSRVIEISPGNEAAWQTVARMSREGVLTAKQQKSLRHVLDRLFTVFANFPDFTWTIFDDLVAFYDKPKDKNPLYERLIGLYVKAGRPDLACEARLKLTEYLLAQQKPKDAIEGLAGIIKAFPDEGRYVPRMLDKLEEISKSIKDSGPLLVQFYQTFLPKVPPKRDNRPSQYCMQMYERGIELFKAQGQTALAQAYEVQLAKLKGGKN